MRRARPSRARPRRRRGGSAPLAHTFAPGDPAALLDAIERARASEPDLVAAARFAAAHRWPAALDAELATWSLRGARVRRAVR